MTVHQTLVKVRVLSALRYQIASWDFIATSRKSNLLASIPRLGVLCGRGKSVDNTEKLPTAISFCTGYGGIEIGLERVVGPVRMLAHVEIEAFAIKNLVEKMEVK